MIFLDLDGVLANFMLQVETYMTRYNLDHYKKPYGNWIDFEKATNTSIFDLLYPKLTRIEILNFWATMPKYTWTHDLIKIMTPPMGKKDMRILTAVTKRQSSFTEECVYGKRYWAAVNAPGIKVITCLREEKKNYATPKDTLVDDYNKNVAEFKEAGGKAYLFTNFENFKKGI